jgi:outer membrane usher protein
VPSRYRLLPLTLSLLTALYGGSACAGDGGTVHFDMKTLEARGYSSDLAAFFSKAPRFLPGTHAVTLSVNASRNYHVEALFDDSGNLCFNPTLLAALRLRHDPAATGCANISADWPGTSVKLLPGQFRVEVTLPEEAFDPALREGAYQSGGTGALLNYDLFMQRMDAPTTDMNYLQATIEPGINIAGWSLRDRGVFTQSQGQRSYSQQEAYAQHAVGSMNALMQAGQVSAFGESFGGLPMLGVQIGSDSAQTGAGRLVVPIQGIASTRATIEVRQRGRVLYRTVVPPGPFLLSNIDGLSGGTDIEVEVIEENGKRNRFTVAARTGGASIQDAPVWSAGIGRYRNPVDGDDGDDGDDGAGNGNGNGREPLLVTGEYSYNPVDRLRLTTSGLFAGGYQSLASHATLAASDSTWVSGGLRYAHTGGFGHGFEFNMMGSSTLGPNLSASLSWLSRSSRYADSADAFGPISNLTDGSRIRRSADASISWAHPRWGAVSYAVNYSSYFNGGSAGFTHTLNLARQFGPANVNLSLQASPSTGNAIYANLSMPLGKGSLHSSVQRQTNGKVAANTTYNGQFGRAQSYSLGASGDAGDQSVNASASMTTAYTQLGAGISQTTSNTRSAYLSATGALVYADGLFGTASSHVSDTFAMVQVPDHAGLRVDSPSGTAITNMNGTAVIPSIPPYSKVELRVDSRSLPLNTRLDTTTVDLGLTRGSVATYKIRATEVRQLLLEIRDSTGQLVPLGTTVYDQAGSVMGTIVGDGNFMLINDDIGKTLRLGGASACNVSYPVPERFDPKSSYEEAKATCS